MKTRSLTAAAGVMGMALAAWTVAPARAQIDTQVKVHMPYTAQVGDKTLPPGDYTIREEDRTTNNNVLLIYGDNGMKFETSAMTIPAEKLNTPEHTRVILGQLGNQYYFRKLWVAGANYGFEFPLPDNIKSREKEMTEVAVNSQPSNQSQTQNSAAVTPPPPPPPATHPEANQPAQNANQSAENRNQPASPSKAAPPVEEQTPPATPQQSANSGNANREEGQPNQSNRMPKTSAGWLMMLLSGGTLSGAGMMLRRKR